MVGTASCCWKAVYLEFTISLTINLEYGEGSGGRGGGGLGWREEKSEERREKKRKERTGREGVLGNFREGCGYEKEEGTQNLKFSNLCTVHKNTHLPISEKARI